METTKTTDALMEGAKITEQWLKDSSEAMTEIYNKQLNLALGFYNNAFNAMSGGSKNNTQNSLFNPMVFAQDLGKWSWNPFTGNTSANPFAGWFEKASQQMQEYNQHLLEITSNAAKTGETSWAGFFEKYKEVLSGRLGMSSEVLNALNEACTGQMSFTLENNKKVMEQLSRQFAELMKQSQKFWVDAIKTNGQETKQRKNDEMLPLETKKKINGVAA
ncbi:MAG: hypothetical protein ACXVPQ_11195 [Bacteroidia bacterium]